MTDTLIVNLWGGPGTGKSTNAALVFGKLKVLGISAELVHEYAKDLTWEERHAAIANQPYIMAKQQFHIERVMGKVEVIVTDSPLPFGLIYKGEAYTPALGEHILETFDGWRNLNIYLERDVAHHPYVQAGRNQNEAQARLIDVQIRELLEEQGMEFEAVPIMQDEATADLIVDLVTITLHFDKK